MEYQYWRSILDEIFQFAARGKGAGLLAIGVLLLAAAPQQAAAQMLFARGEITLVPQLTLPGLAEERPVPPSVKIRARKPVTLSAEIRSAQSFQQPSLYLTRSLEGNQAILVKLETPTPATQNILGDEDEDEDEDEESEEEAAPLTISPANVYAPLDMLALNAEGEILRIWPKLILSQLAVPIRLPDATRAILYLAPDRTASLGFLPQDKLQHPMFEVTPESLR